MTARKNISNKCKYVDTVVALYLQMPDTPLKPSANDRITASGFFDNGIPLLFIEAALLLASIRRISRNGDQTPLSPVRSLAYFVPVIQELVDTTMPDGYLQYLRRKLQVKSPR